MERDRGGDQPFDVILPPETSKEFTQDYLRRIVLRELYKMGETALRPPLRLAPVILSASADGLSAIELGAHHENTPEDRNHYKTYFDVIVTDFEAVEVLNLSDESRAVFQQMINETAKRLEEEGELEKALTLRGTSTSLHRGDANLRIGVETIYSFSLYGDMRCRRSTSVAANRVTISSKQGSDYAIQSNSSEDELALDGYLSAITLEDLYMIADKLEQAGMIPSGEAQIVQRRYPRVLMGHKSI